MREEIGQIFDEALGRRDFYRVEDEARDLIAGQQLVGDAAGAVRQQLRQERTKQSRLLYITSPSPSA